MSYKFNFDDNQILNHKFSPATKGYDALEVDRFFDKVISDYQETKKALIALKKLETDYARLIMVKSDLEARVKLLENRILDYERTNGNHRDNFENIRRIAAYEKYLWSIGHDPKKIK
ncbi:MAG TPA: DivIVA domain-containing protein [Bacilli bacterium]|nr:DivIVA domain-containing protein [Bacilli bacterium]